MYKVVVTAEFERWLSGLRDQAAQARITSRVLRLEDGLFGDAKPVGAGVSELRIDVGPGYRVYFFRAGSITFVLLAGGDKRSGETFLWRKGWPPSGRKEWMVLEIREFDASKFLESEEGIEEFMIAAFETGDAAFIAKSLGVVAKARNMSRLAREVGMSRSALYRALSGEGNPEFATIAKVMNALGLEMTVMPATGRKAA